MVRLRNQGKPYKPEKKNWWIKKEQQSYKEFRASCQKLTNKHMQHFSPCAQVQNLFTVSLDHLLVQEPFFSTFMLVSFEDLPVLCPIHWF